MAFGFYPDEHRGDEDDFTTEPSSVFNDQPPTETDFPFDSATAPDSLFTDTPLFATVTTSADVGIVTTSISTSTSSTDTPLTTTTPSAASVPATSQPSTTQGSPTIASVAAASSTDSIVSAASTQKSGASPAAIGVTVTLLILAACAGAFFLYRRRARAQRNLRRQTWNMPTDPPRTEAVPFDLEKASSRGSFDKDIDDFENIDINEKIGPTLLPNDVNFKAVPVKLPSLPPALAPNGFAPPRMPSPPPLDSPTFSSPNRIDLAPSFGGGGPTPLITSTPFSATTPSRAADSSVVIVARTFVPTLPDELSIQTGEQVRVICRYDDGWAHVERLRNGVGENGVVPLECLELRSGPSIPGSEAGLAGAGLAQEAVESWRLSKRKSSLHPVGPVHY